jgi:predicted transcriptional regulator YdeE
MMETLQKEILALLCKVEKIFPPGWFNPMQHLLIHLLYEGKVGGPVQYRWMYPFERALKRLRHMVGNKARVERCIAKDFKYKEIAYFTSVYFTEEHNVNAPTMWYHVHVSVFAPARYRVGKIACSYSEVVLGTMRNYKAHYSLSWFRPLL